jgi:tRNA (guanine26-N2/guanine27-N2)-dimethyltransferase
MQRKREKKANQKGDEVTEKKVIEVPTDKIVCGRTEVPSKCGTCGSHLMIGGPIWHDKIHNMDFVK